MLNKHLLIPFGAFNDGGESLVPANESDSCMTHARMGGNMLEARANVHEHPPGNATTRSPQALALPPPAPDTGLDKAAACVFRADLLRTNHSEESVPLDSFVPNSIRLHLGLHANVVKSKIKKGHIVIEP